jgi:hypothetical protein
MRGFIRMMSGRSSRHALGRCLGAPKHRELRTTIAARSDVRVRKNNHREIRRRSRCVAAKRVSVRLLGWPIWPFRRCDNDSRKQRRYSKENSQFARRASYQRTACKRPETTTAKAYKSLVAALASSRNLAVLALRGVALMHLHRHHPRGWWLLHSPAVF